MTGEVVVNVELVEKKKKRKDEKEKCSRKRDKGRRRGWVRGLIGRSSKQARHSNQSMDDAGAVERQYNYVCRVGGVVPCRTLFDGT